jgi:hypothetical protein
MIEKGKPYIGIVLDGIDLEKHNKFPIYIRSLSSPGQKNIFWATNEIAGNNFSRWIDPRQHASQASAKRSAGSYFPLAIGMIVEVIFRTTDISDGYVSKILNAQGLLPLNDKLKNDFYLLCKSVNNSYIYIDDNREIIHMMNAGGKTNVLLDSDKIVLHVGELKNGGTDGITDECIAEISDSGMIFKYLDNFIRMDASGIILSAGTKSASYIQITENGIKYGSNGDITLNSTKNLNLIGNNTYLTGIETVDVYSTNTKISGAQMLNLTGNVVSIDSMLETYIKGGHIKIDALLKLSLSSLMVETTALANLYMSSLNYTNTSGVITNDAPLTVNNSATTLQDGVILSNMQFARSSATSMNLTQKGLSLSTELAAASMVTAMGTNDPVSGSIANILNGSLTGSANPANNLISLPTLVPITLDGANMSVSYINGYNVAGNNVTLPPLPTPITI